jgi:hypothetical protein
MEGRARVTVGRGVEVPLAARRASSAREDGAMSFVEVGREARTGASNRGSSMAAVMVGGVAACSRDFSRFERSSPRLGLAPIISATFPQQLEPLQTQEEDSKRSHSISYTLAMDINRLKTHVLSPQHTAP